VRLLPDLPSAWGRVGGDAAERPAN
jgi:hypothetical protein